MSAYSTETVSRDYAVGSIIGKVLKATNEELADLLFEIQGRDSLQNYIVVDNEDEIPVPIRINLRSKE